MSDTLQFTEELAAIRSELACIRQLFEPLNQALKRGDEARAKTVKCTDWPAEMKPAVARKYIAITYGYQSDEISMTTWKRIKQSGLLTSSRGFYKRRSIDRAMARFKGGKA